MESFEQIAEQYKPMIHKIINSLHLYKDKEEFYQHGLIALWEVCQRFNPEKGDFTNYAYTFIRGRLLVELRKIALAKERCVSLEEEFWRIAGDFQTDRTLEREILLSYCETLTTNQQKWLLYTYWDDLTVKKIAELEKVTVSAVKQWRTGAREKIKVAIMN
ncbi:sigma-70 family RNA polymerase sigma factor [Neobacillus citreus]|uniref:Sigma-70 family RNA polymerase sigma factor n=1 Tax=Neobacillus citreus TaxID=2833578 RepID=A0A942T6X9_9BACI|nr:sigma-70 family RNA polymerase sigma factor [Neobacillus citreus]MCH6269354.1 sigma-70 family RNA polymerase sigma factor [Neobacillus citreus]